MCQDKNGKVKFSMAEAITSGADGKSSATGFIGVALTILSMAIIVISFGFYLFVPSESSTLLAFVDKAIIILGIGAALLGTRKITGVLGSAKHANIVSTVEEIMNRDKNHESEHNDETVQNDTSKQQGNIMLID